MQALQDRIWVLMEVPASSIPAYLVYLVLMTAIVVSIVNFVISSMTLMQPHLGYLNLVEYACTAIFGLEYIVRFTVCPNKAKFMRSFYNTIDLVSISPTIIDQCYQAYLRNTAVSSGGQAPGQLSSGGGTISTLDYNPVVSDLRLLRMLRLLKFAKTYSGIHICLLALERSAQAVGMLIFFLVSTVVVFSSLLWFCERGTGAEGFKSIPVAMWWGIVTMASFFILNLGGPGRTPFYFILLVGFYPDRSRFLFLSLQATVGYGDVTPITTQGRWVAAVAIVTALLLLSLPISVIGHNFVEVLREYNEQHEELMNQLRLQNRAMGSSTNALAAEESVDLRAQADKQILQASREDTSAILV